MNSYCIFIKFRSIYYMKKYSEDESFIRKSEKMNWKEIRLNTELLLKLSKNDLKSKYAGSVFGIIWSFIQPLVTIGVFYFVFQVGFKNPPVENIEFVLWISPAYLAWIYFQESLITSSGSLFEYSYLVKKIKFNTYLIPIVKVFSSTYIHFFFILFTFILNILYGHMSQWIWLQIFYYAFCLFFISIGLALFCSAVTVFFKDFSQIISVLLQLGFWATPIFWSAENMSPIILKILKINPLYYIIQGYRDTFITGIPFWHRTSTTLYFWCFTIAALLLGSFVYRKLRVHFADVL